MNGLDRWLTREDEESIAMELLSCDGTATCSCPDCCADVAQAEFDAYVRGERQ